MLATLPPQEDQKRIITRFRDAIVPMDSIPSLGDKVIANCPPGFGLRLHDSEQYRKFGIIRESRSHLNKQHVVLFAAEFLLPDNVKIELWQGGRYGFGGWCIGAAQGHMLLDPIPPMNDPRWQTVSLLYGQFIMRATGEPVTRADIISLHNEDDGCVCRIIKDINAL